MFTEKRIFWHRKFEEKIKRPSTSEWNYDWKNRNNSSACVNLFAEHLSTDKFRHYLRMNSTSYCWSYIGFHTLTFLYYLHFTYSLLIQRALVTSSYIDFYNSLQYTFFISTNNFFSNDAWGGFFRKSIWLNETFSFWKPKLSFSEIFYESLKNSLIGI